MALPQTHNPPRKMLPRLWRKAAGKPMMDEESVGKKESPPSGAAHWQSLWHEGGFKAVEDDEDAAEPVGDSQRFWKEALLGRGMGEEAGLKPDLSPETRGTKGEETVENTRSVASPCKRVWTDGPQRNVLSAARTVHDGGIEEDDEFVFLPTLSRPPARPSLPDLRQAGAYASATSEVEAEEDENEDGPAIHPTLSHASSLPSPSPFSNSTIIFTDPSSGLPAQQQVQLPGSSTARVDMMFKRCRATKTYATEEGMGGSWMLVRADDASEEWQMVEGAEVEVDCELVREAVRHRSKDGTEEGGRRAFNERIRVFFEDEKARREREREMTVGEGVEE